jgi:hypothetical protein
MTTLIIEDYAPVTFDPLLPISPVSSEWERKVIDANYRLARAKVVRRDYKHEPDGMQRYLRHLEQEWGQRA